MAIFTPSPTALLGQLHFGFFRPEKAKYSFSKLLIALTIFGNPGFLSFAAAQEATESVEASRADFAIDPERIEINGEKREWRVINEDNGDVYLHMQIPPEGINNFDFILTPRSQMPSGTSRVDYSVVADGGTIKTPRDAGFARCSAGEKCFLYDVTGIYFTRPEFRFEGGSYGTEIVLQAEEIQWLQPDHPVFEDTPKLRIRFVETLGGDEVILVASEEMGATDDEPAVDEPASQDESARNDLQRNRVADTPDEATPQPKNYFGPIILPNLERALEDQAIDALDSLEEWLGKSNSRLENGVGIPHDIILRGSADDDDSDYHLDYTYIPQKEGWRPIINLKATKKRGDAGSKEQGISLGAERTVNDNVLVGGFVSGLSMEDKKSFLGADLKTRSKNVGVYTSIKGADSLVFSGIASKKQGSIKTNEAIKVATKIINVEGVDTTISDLLGEDAEGFGIESDYDLTVIGLSVGGSTKLDTVTIKPRLSYSRASGKFDSPTVYGAYNLDNFLLEGGENKIEVTVIEAAPRFEYEPTPDSNTSYYLTPAYNCVKTRTTKRKCHVLSKVGLNNQLSEKTSLSVEVKKTPGDVSTTAGVRFRF